MCYAVELNNQDELCAIFPQLYSDLLNASMDTLSLYIVKYKHLPIQEPSSELETEILKKMCLDATETIDSQCSRQYCFGKFHQDKPRATQVLQYFFLTLILWIISTMHMYTLRFFLPSMIWLSNHRKILIKVNMCTVVIIYTTVSVSRKSTQVILMRMSIDDILLLQRGPQYPKENVRLI